MGTRSIYLLALLFGCGGGVGDPMCTPMCDGLQCGDDGCGGTCGACGAPETCGGTGVAGVCGTPTHSCGMQLNENPVAFCETFERCGVLWLCRWQLLWVSRLAPTTFRANSP